MKRPVNISPKIFNFIKSKVKDEKELKSAFKKPISFMLDHGVLETPEILRNAVFELETGEEVQIRTVSIEGIQKRDNVMVARIYDMTYLTLTYSQFIDQFSKSELLDYTSEKQYF